MRLYLSILVIVYVVNGWPNNHHKQTANLANHTHHNRKHSAVFPLIIHTKQNTSAPVQNLSSDVGSIIKAPYRSSPLQNTSLDHHKHTRTSMVPKSNHRKRKEKAGGQVQEKQTPKVACRKDNKKAKNVNQNHNKKGEKRYKHLKTEDIKNLGLVVHGKDNLPEITSGGVGRIIEAPYRRCPEGMRRAPDGQCKNLFH